MTRTLSTHRKTAPFPPVDVQRALLAFPVWTEDVIDTFGTGAVISVDDLRAHLGTSRERVDAVIAEMVKAGFARDVPGHIGPHGWCDRAVVITTAGVAARARQANRKGVIVHV